MIELLSTNVNAVAFVALAPDAQDTSRNPVEESNLDGLN
jgi:hypothetical protein